MPGITGNGRHSLCVFSVGIKDLMPNAPIALGQEISSFPEVILFFTQIRFSQIRVAFILIEATTK